MYKVELDEVYFQKSYSFIVKFELFISFFELYKMTQNTNKYKKIIFDGILT